MFPPLPRRHTHPHTGGCPIPYPTCSYCIISGDWDLGGNLSAGNRTGAGAENLMRPHTSLGLPPSVYMQYTYIQYIPYTYRIQRGPYTVYSAEGVYRYAAFPRVPVSGAAIHTVHTRHLAIEYAFSAHMPILSPSLRICTFLGFSRGVRSGVRSPRGDQK